MEFDQVLKQMQELTDAVKSGGMVDKERAQAEFAVLMQAYVDQQIQAKLDAQPQRRVSGALIGPDGTAISKSNRYYRMLKSFEHDGYHRVGTRKAKPVDLWLTHRAISKAHAMYQAGLTSVAIAAPSDDLAQAVKALTSTGTGTGDELVPTDMAEALWEDFFLASRIAGTIEAVPMPTNPFDIPLGLGSITWRKGAERTATTPSDPATAKSTLTATELVTEQNWSYTMQEDAIAATMPGLRARLAQSGGEIIDDFALNADATAAATGNINSDDALPTSDSYYLSDGQDGLRHQWLVDNTNQTVNAGGDALADEDITNALGKMGKYAIDPNQCVMACDISTYLNGFLKLSNVTTVDKLGPNAVVLTGQLAVYRGIPIIVSASHRLAEADGKRSATEANNTLGSLTIYNRMMWHTGFIRELLIEIDRDIQKRSYIMVTSLREAIAAHGTRATNTHTAGVRNILV